jgi:hypothetical protein
MRAILYPTIFLLARKLKGKDSIAPKNVAINAIASVSSVKYITPSLKL